MRVLFPFAFALAILVMLAASVASAIASLVIPICLVLVGALGIASLRAIAAGFQLIKLGVQALTHSFSFVADVLALIFHWPSSDEELTDSPTPELMVHLKSPQFPELHRLQHEVAGLLGKKPVDEVWVSPDTALGIGTALRDGVRIRFLAIGLGLVRIMSPEQLRAALLHEFGHEKGGDLWLGRWARRFIHRLTWAVDQFAGYNPAFWAAVLGLMVVKVGYLPWSRAKEYAADRWSARFAGPAVSAEALRVVRREGPAVELGLMFAVSRARQRKQVPPRLSEAAFYIASRLPAVERHRLGVAVEGDPLALGGRTHPTIALRIAAMSKLPAVQAAAVLPFDAERLAALDEQLTKRWLQGVGKPVTLEQFIVEERAPEPRRAISFDDVPVVGGALEPVGAAPDDGGELELDAAGDWWRNKKE